MWHKIKKQKKVFISLLFIIILLGGFIWVWRIPRADGTIKDQTKIQKIDYSNYWEYLFSKNGKRVKEIQITLDYRYSPSKDRWLKICGGDSRSYYFLKDDDGKEIRTKEELVQWLGEIKTPEEAIALLYACHCGYEPKFQIAKQFVNKYKNDYLVNLISYISIGCGDHAHSLVTYFVSKEAMSLT